MGLMEGLNYPGFCSLVISDKFLEFNVLLNVYTLELNDIDKDVDGG